MKFRSTLLAASILALPLAAANAAEPLKGLYVGAGVGANFMQDEKVSLNNLNSVIVSGVQTKLSTNPGFAGLLAVGYGFGNGLRAELEGDFKYNSFTSNGNSNTQSAGGNEQKYGAMVNALYDFNNVVPWMVPYVGVGVGYQAVQWSNVRASSTSGGDSIFVASDNATKSSFAYQGIAGVSFPITPQLSLTGEYHFMGLASDRTYGGRTTVNTAATASAPASSVSALSGFKASDNYNHTILVGFRYSFNAPPASAVVVAAAPAPAPSRSYLVFFDWDKYNITDRARQIIKDAAVNSTKVQYTKIEVNGFTDTSGTPKYNLGLSVRRAQAVAAELVKDGVPKNAIAITGFGDTKLLVPTGPNVREPQNRRVEIVIR
jgi:OOP family OmpA-OmpF porin